MLRKIIVISALLIVLPFNLLADVVHLRDGKKAKGSVVISEDGTILLERSSRRHDSRNRPSTEKYSADEVLAIIWGDGRIEAVTVVTTADSLKYRELVKEQDEFKPDATTKTFGWMMTLLALGVGILSLSWTLSRM